MNLIVLAGWKDRLHAAEAVLSAPAFHERSVRRALTNAVDALGEAIARQEESISHVQQACRAADASERRRAMLLRNVPIPAIETSRFGEITELNPAAMTLLGMSERSAVGKSLVLFLDDRTSWLRLLQQLDAAPSLQRPVRLHPKERAPKAFLAVVVAVDDLRQWFFLPVGPAESPARQTTR